MKLTVQNLDSNTPQHIEIKGSEEWIQDLYKEFPSDSDKTAPQITCTLTWSLTAGSYYHIKGDINFFLPLTCTRCAKQISHQFNEFVSQDFTTDNLSDDFDQESLVASEHAMEELNNGELDLQQFLFDFIMLHIPAQTHDLEEHECIPNVSEDSSGETAVHKSPNKNNPFAVLEQLKKDKKH